LLFFGVVLFDTACAVVALNIQLAQRSALKGQTDGVVDDAVEDGIGVGRCYGASGEADSIVADN
jgi:hypothetical protein